MPDVTEIDAITGIVIERDYTPEELEQRAKDAIVYAEREAEIAAKEAAKASALAKLSALGLTEDEVRSITGGN